MCAVHPPLSDGQYKLPKTVQQVRLDPEMLGSVEHCARACAAGYRRHGCKLSGLVFLRIVERLVRESHDDIALLEAAGLFAVIVARETVVKGVDR
jgi:hypothetical protein